MRYKSYLAFVRLLSKACISMATLVTIVLSLFHPAIMVQAAAELTISPLTWNVVGLDSNKVIVGPNTFPIGARVCNTGDTLITDLTSSFEWGSSDPFIELRPGSLASYSGSMAVASLTPGACTDFYYEVQITRNPSAYGHTRRYTITADSAETSPIRTPTPREIYVERLISQNRNSVTDVKLDNVSIPNGGTMTVLVGNTYNIQLVGSTATNGYNELESFLNLSNANFRINSIVSTYTVTNLPSPHDYLYADSCGWDNNPDSPTYRSCIVSKGKTGGEVTNTYNVTVIAGGGTTQPLDTLIYDFSGSSFHYNNDYSTSTRYVAILNQPTLSKAFLPDTILAGGVSTLTFTLTNPNSIDLTGAAFNDDLPSGLRVASPPSASTTCAGATFSPVSGDTSLSFTGGIIPANGSCTAQVNVTADAAGDYVNTSGFLSTCETGTNTGPDGFGSDTLTVIVHHPGLKLTKQVSISPSGPWTSFITVLAGTPVYYRLTVENTGDVDLTGVSVSDPKVDLTGCLLTTPFTLSIADPVKSCIVGPVTAPVGDFINTATAHGYYNGTEYTSTSSAETLVLTSLPSADLLITKTDGVEIVSANGTTIYTVRVINHGPDAVDKATLVDVAGTGLVLTDVACSSAVGNRCTPSPQLSDLTSTGIILPLLGKDQFYEIMVTATVTAQSGKVTNTVTVTPPVGTTDPTPANNTAEDTDTLGIYRIWIPFAASSPFPQIISWDAVIGYEDLPLNTGQNDFDYNDWAVALDSALTYISPSSNLLQSLTISFAPRTRGGIYDHTFQIRFPAQTFASNGSVIVNLYDQDHNLISTQVQPFYSATDNQYLIFDRTSEVFPGSVINTVEGGPTSSAQRYADLTLTFNTPVPFTFDTNSVNQPHGQGLFFDPTLAVLNTGDYIQRGDVRLLSIPSKAWLWPEESIRIDWAYPLVLRISGFPPDFYFPDSWWTVYNHCVYDGVPCGTP